MLIGTSYSKCIKDIITGVKSEQDVLMIITKTDIKDFNSQSEFETIWSHYQWANPVWSDLHSSLKEPILKLSLKMLANGKIYQPRSNGAETFWYYTDSMGSGHWFSLVPDNWDHAPAPVQKAWNTFKTVANLTGENV